MHICTHTQRVRVYLVCVCVCVCGRAGSLEVCFDEFVLKLTVRFLFGGLWLVDMK